MIPLATPFPDINPVAIAIGPVAVKWYGLSYLVGLLLGWLYIKRLLAEPRIWRGGTAPFAPEKVDDFLIYVTLATVVGGRLGYVLLYEPSTYIASPLEVFAVWKGGMSFHGALIGCTIATWIFARRNGIDPWTAMDLGTAAVPIGLFFGRLANFANAELWGRTTDVAWAVRFCNDHIKSIYGGHCPAGEVPRHPSQLYEAALEGVVLFLVLRVLTHRLDALHRPGTVAGAFLVGYALARSIAELFREPHAVHALNLGPLTAGQVYSLPMLAIGIYFIWRARAAAPA